MRILENVTDKAEPKSSLDELQWGGTDEGFGMPEFKEHTADTLSPAILRDWTARDFASIYIRFRPHLERHAKRFLSNPSQVEEVVQDAFLYLMTTLPELDSEFGVLKFLKWKVRMLSLDVVRAGNRAKMSTLDQVDDLCAEDLEVSELLERAEDAAIVSLALAKLQPRHREALVATLYEEKSTEEVASQMGLSSNAFRQLLFRARSAFRRALVGETETAGLDISQILSIAARKAADDARSNVPKIGAVVLILGASLFGIEQNEIVPTNSFAKSDSPLTYLEQSQDSDSLVRAAENENDPIKSAGVKLSAPITELDAERERVEQNPRGQSAQQEPHRVSSAPSTSVNEVDDSENQLARVLNEVSVSELSLGDGSARVEGELELLTVSNDQGLTAHLGVDLASEKVVQFAYFSLSLNGDDLTAVPLSSLSVVERLDDGTITRLSFAVTDLLVGDFEGKFGYASVGGTHFSRNGLIIKITFSADLKPQTAEFEFIPRAQSSKNS